MPDTVTEQPSPFFVLFARGPGDDPEVLRCRWEEWHEREGSENAGWLASTGGIASGGEWLAAVRYSSEEAARAATQAGKDSGLLAGATSVDVTGDVHVVRGNGSPVGAGFVQVMQARVPDRHRFEAVEAAVGDRFATVRRDFLAGLRAWTGPDRLTVVDWFTSEADARAGEAIQIPADLGALFGEWMSLLHEVSWYDLVEPWQVTSKPAP